ncbi:MAG: formylglycine-generating enzyme family protein [Phycisphaerales bacterium]
MTTCFTIVAPRLRTRRGHPGSVPARRRRSPLAAAVVSLCAAAPAPAQGTSPLPPPIIQKLPGTTVTLTLVPIPAGPAEVPDPAAPGGKRTIHVQPLFASTTEITWDLYDLYVFRLDESEPDADKDRPPDATSRPSKPYIPPDRGFGHAGYPAISMTFEGAEGFCQWLSARTGRRYRLPTEAEWEHMARAGAPAASPYSAGITPDTLPDHTWHSANSPDKTQPVATRKANPWGLHDLHGNAAEWVRAHAADGKPTTKGGSYRDDAGALAIAARAPQAPGWNASDPQFPKSQWWLADCTWVGFRVVLEPGPPPSTPAAPAHPPPTDPKPKEPTHGPPNPPN